MMTRTTTVYEREGGLSYAKCDGDRVMTSTRAER
jgi:hypothetical protein